MSIFENIVLCKDLILFIIFEVFQTIVIFKNSCCLSIKECFYYENFIVTKGITYYPSLSTPSALFGPLATSSILIIS